MNILGLIPARGGSKGIKNKNLVPLNGRPLIAYTCRAAKGSRLLSRVILSTDDRRIAAFVGKAGIEVPFLRPKQLAKDTSPMIAVLRHALAQLQSKERYRPEAVLLLQPTSPLRTARHIDDAIRLFLKTKADTLVSVTEVPHQFLPGSLMKEKGGRLRAIAKGAMVLRRQDKPALLARNGPAILIVRRRWIERDRLYGPKVVGFRMDKSESIDIDDRFDLAVAGALLR